MRSQVAGRSTDLTPTTRTSIDGVLRLHPARFIRLRPDLHPTDLTLDHFPADDVTPADVTVTPLPSARPTGPTEHARHG